MSDLLPFARPTLSRRSFLLLTVGGLVAGCGSISSPGTPTPALSPAQTIPPATAPISLANAFQIKQLAVLRPNSSRVRGLAWAPDGKILAVGAWATVQLWKVATGKPVAALAGHSGQVFQVAWSPDGKILASGSDDNTLRLWDSQSHAPLAVLQRTTNAILSVAWSPDGQSLAAGCDDGTVQLWPRSTWNNPRLLQGPLTPGQYRAGRYAQGVYGVTWSPDGKRVVGTRYDGYIRIWEASSGRLLHTLVPSNQPNGLSWTSAGHVLASSSDDGSVQLWDPVTYKNTGTLQTTDQISAGWAYAIPWSPDGRMLAVSRDSGTIQVFNVQTGKELAILQGHLASCWTADWSPDGLRIASGSDDGTVCLWGIH